MALSCANRAGEFGMSIANDWQDLGLGSALLQEIERKAAADGIELLFGDTLQDQRGDDRTGAWPRLPPGPGFEPRLVRIQKRLEDAAPDLPCRKWSEIARRAEPRAA